MEGSRNWQRVHRVAVGLEPLADLFHGSRRPGERTLLRRVDIGEHNIPPHLSMDRAVILSEGATVRLRAYSDYPSMLTVDGQVVVELGEGEEVVVVGSPHLARFVRVRERSYFYQTLMEKMQWTGH